MKQTPEEHRAGGDWTSGQREGYQPPGLSGTETSVLNPLDAWETGVTGHS